MPEVLAHHGFARDCLERSPSGLDTGLLLAGAQGPDPFYYYGNIPWKKRKGTDAACAFAEDLHRMEPGDLYRGIVLQACARPEPERSGMLAFVAGLVLHYLLDRSLHPYVYFMSGFDADGTLSSQYLAAHRRFEASLATALYARIHPRSPLRHPWLWMTKSVPGIEVADRLVVAASAGKLSPGTYTDAWADMAAVNAILYDPWGIKAALLDFLAQKPASKLSGRLTAPGALTALARKIRPLMLPPLRSLRLPTDFLNEGGAAWRHPVSGETTTASAMDLYREALDRGAAVITLFEGLRAGAAPADGWQNIFDGRNHEGLHSDERLRFHAGTKAANSPDDEQ